MWKMINTLVAAQIPLENSLCAAARKDAPHGRLLVCPAFLENSTVYARPAFQDIMLVGIKK